MANPLLTAAQDPWYFYRQPSASDPIDQAYTSAFGRPADPTGHAFWQQKMNAGMSPQEVERQLRGSGEGYLTQMFGPSKSAWQTQARAQTMATSQLPGVLGGPYNPLLDTPESASAILFPQDAPGAKMISAILDPNSEFMKSLTTGVVKAEEKPEVEDKKKPSAPVEGTEGMNFLERARLARRQARQQAQDQRS